MLQVRKKTGSKLTAILLALMMAVVFMPTFAFAADGDEGGAAEDITVYMTVSDQGVIAKTKDGDAMAWKEVTVKDLDESGDFTYDEALKAAHEAYNSADGYVLNSSGWVKQVWGLTNDAAGFYFLQNGAPADLVTETKVKAGDYLSVSSNRDTELYADWAASFNEFTKSVKTGETFELTLTGFPSMTMNQPVTGENVKIGTWENGGFEAIEDAKTDSDGKVELSFDEAGTYIITADPASKVEDELYIGDDEGGLYKLVKMGRPEGSTDVIYGTMDWVTQDTSYAYTDENYEDGPYPYDKIKYVDYSDYDDVDDFIDSIEGFPLYSADVLYNCPIVAPCCVVNVLDTADVYVTVNNKGDLATTKDGEPMVMQEVTAIDWNADGVVSYEEALVEAHKAYCKDGAEGFGTADSGWITKLWGVETSNTLFCVNNESISPDFPKTKAVEDGDELYASVNADDKYYVDYMSFFREIYFDTESGKEVKLNLQGFLGMGYGEQLTPAPLEGIQIGYWYDGDFIPIDGAVTDANGVATFSPDEEGDYLLTAKGTVHTTAHDWATDTDVETDAPIMAPFGFLHVEKGEGEVSPISAIKKNAVKELLKAYDPANYRTKEQVQVMSALLEAQFKILDAKTNAEVKAAVAAAKETLDTVTTDAEYKAQEDAVKAVKVDGVKAKAGKKKVTVTWKKNTEDFDGYQVSYAMKGKKAKTANITKNTTAKKVKVK